MTGIYPHGHWYNLTLALIIRFVNRTILIAALACAIGAKADAQGEPEQRPRMTPITLVGVDYTVSLFQDDFAPWHLGAVWVGTRRSAGTFIARANVARRFAKEGAQFELDAYPALGPKMYAYLNAGYSAASLFPERRYGAEIFRTLPRAYEASAGIRYLGFLGGPVTLFTGSVGRYTGRYWLSLRPYVRDTEDGLTASTTFMARRYANDPESWLGARIGYGRTPSEVADVSQLLRTRSVTAGLQGSHAVSARTVVSWILNFEREQRPTSTLNRWELGSGIKLRY
jgi:YaiO family outer membrane protein